MFFIVPSYSSEMHNTVVHPKCVRTLFGALSVQYIRLQLSGRVFLQTDRGLRPLLFLRQSFLGPITYIVREGWLRNGTCSGRRDQSLPGFDPGSFRSRIQCANCLGHSDDSMFNFHVLCCYIFFLRSHCWQQGHVVHFDESCRCG